MKCMDCGDIPQTVNGVDHVCKDWLTNGRTVTLHNISVERCKCGDSPAVPRIAKLLLLLNSGAGDHAYWQTEGRAWAIRNE